jgi:hypothetical protein
MSAGSAAEHAVGRLEGAIDRRHEDPAQQR